MCKCHRYVCKLFEIIDIPCIPRFLLPKLFTLAFSEHHTIPTPQFIKPMMGILHYIFLSSFPRQARHFFSSELSTTPNTQANDSMRGVFDSVFAVQHSHWQKQTLNTITNNYRYSVHTQGASRMHQACIQNTSSVNGGRQDASWMMMMDNIVECNWCLCCGKAELNIKN